MITVPDVFAVLCSYMRTHGLLVLLLVHLLGPRLLCRHLAEDEGGDLTLLLSKEMLGQWLQAIFRQPEKKPGPTHR